MKRLPYYDDGQVVIYHGNCLEMDWPAADDRIRGFSGRRTNDVLQSAAGAVSLDVPLHEGRGRGGRRMSDPRTVKFRSLEHTELRGGTK